MRVLIVGAGLYGATIARVLRDNDHEVMVVERRPYIGGQVHTEWNAEVGCHVHMHGPHIFRTSNERVWEFVNRFAEFNSFVNRPKVLHEDRLYSFPINLMTLYQVFGCKTPEHAKKMLEKDRVPNDNPRNMEEWCKDRIGPTLYNIFIEGYTTKQWGKHPTDLPATLLQRLPIRLTFDDNYYKGNPKQGIPIGGYTALVEKMLEGVPVMLDTDFLKDAAALTADHDVVVYSGAIDEFFDYDAGVLTYRSMEFESMTYPVPDYQGNAVINYTDIDVPWTRVMEHKHFDLLENNTSTIVTWEYPHDHVPGMDATYPLRTPESRAMYENYAALAAKHHPKMEFGGRLGTYAYLDMDQVISSALAKARDINVR